MTPPAQYGESGMFGGKALEKPESIQPKCDFHADLYVYRPTIFEGRLETPLLHRFNRLAFQSVPQPVDDANIAWMALGVNNQPEDTRALGFCFAGCFRILRVGCRDRPRRRYPAANFEYSPTNATAAPRTNTGPVTSADSAGVSRPSNTVTTVL
jgi:hypothetical protein